MTEYPAEPEWADRAGHRRRTGTHGRAATLFNGSHRRGARPVHRPGPWLLTVGGAESADAGARRPPSRSTSFRRPTRQASGGNGPAALVPLERSDDAGRQRPLQHRQDEHLRWLVDMLPLPVGESPTTYCSDMEQIQGTRFQQDANLLIKNRPGARRGEQPVQLPGDAPAASFQNLNCGCSACRTTCRPPSTATASWSRPASPTRLPRSPGRGNPMAGTTTCPATTASSSPE